MYKTIDPDQVRERIRGNEAVNVLDVREQDEWESGHIPGAKHIPLGQLPTALNALNPKEEVVVVCRSGNRSGRACEYLSSHGYNVVNMTGGMLKWTGDLSFD